MHTIVDFFSYYLKDKAAFYALWVDENPQVLTPFVSDDIAVCTVGEHNGWDGIKGFWGPIFDEMEGQLIGLLMHLFLEKTLILSLRVATVISMYKRVKHRVINTYSIMAAMFKHSTLLMAK